jgi:hypothetical protein
MREAVAGGTEAAAEGTEAVAVGTEAAAEEPLPTRHSVELKVFKVLDELSEAEQAVLLDAFAEDAGREAEREAELARERARVAELRRQLTAALEAEREGRRRRFLLDKRLHPPGTSLLCAKFVIFKERVLSLERRAACIMRQLGDQDNGRSPKGCGRTPLPSLGHGTSSAL